MFKLRFSNPMYHTYDNDRITVCKYECTVLDCSKKEVIQTFKVIGKSICSPEDTIDVRMGKMIAEGKAKLLAYSKMSNYYSQSYIDYLTEQVKGMIDELNFIYQMKFLTKSERKHLDLIVSNELPPKKK